MAMTGTERELAAQLLASGWSPTKVAHAIKRKRDRDNRREDVSASKTVETFSLTEAQVRGLVRVMDDFGVAVRSLRMAMVDTGHAEDELLVTLDGGHGTYSFFLLESGEERTAGMGESL